MLPPQVLRQYHNLLVFDSAFNLVHIVGYQADVADNSTYPGIHSATFYIKAFGEHHGIAAEELGTIAIAVQVYCAVAFVVAGGFGKGQPFIGEVEHIQQVGGPAFVAQPVEHAPAYHLHGRHFAPHTGAEALPVVVVQFGFLLNLLQAGVAQHHHSIGRGYVLRRHFVQFQRAAGATQFTLSLAALLRYGFWLHNCWLFFLAANVKFLPQP